jgi:molybdenum cofactor synthesis domain-containing protein
MGKMRPFKALISYREALDRILPHVRRVDRTEQVPLAEAAGRVLARDVQAPVDVPPFARAAMDGFAVRAHETFGAGKAAPKVLQLAGVLHAGDAPGRALGPGEAIQIATGAKVPEGADAVVRVEDALLAGEQVKVEVPVYPGRNVSAAGVDIRRGAAVLRAGQVLQPAHVGVLASMGMTHADVLAKPRVAVLPTGTEVAPPGQPLREGQIHDSNTFTLTALVRQHGGEPVTWGSVMDTLEALEQALDRARDADLVVLSGGSSVGERDLLVDALGKRGELLFHGVQIRPGKPMLAADLGGQLALGFPGYPVSCLTNAYVFLVPVLRIMAGLPEAPPRVVRGVMGERISSQLGRLQIHTVRIAPAASRGGGPGALSKVFSTYKESGALTSMAESDGYILIPENVDLVEEGEEVEVVLW